MTVKDSKMNIDDARRQGQFEGQVLTTLAEIKTSITNLTGNYNGLEGRVRMVETGFSQLTDLIAKQNEINHDKLVDADKTHVNLATANEKMDLRVRKLEDWKIWMMAGAAVVGALIDFVLRAVPSLIKTIH